MPFVALAQGDLVYAILLASGFLLPRGPRRTLVAHRVHRLAVGAYGLATNRVGLAIFGSLGPLAIYTVGLLIASEYEAFRGKRIEDAAANPSDS